MNMKFSLDKKDLYAQFTRELVDDKLHDTITIFLCKMARRSNESHMKIAMRVNNMMLIETICMNGMLYDTSYCSFNSELRKHETDGNCALHVVVKHDFDVRLIKRIKKRFKKN